MQFPFLMEVIISFLLLTGACGGYLRTGEAPGFFFSPRWPQNYNNGADCSWIIHAPDSTVELNILSLNIEPHQSCAYDRLVIRDGKKTDT